MKVIFDFDDVIFLAKEFKQRVFNLLENKGYTSSLIVYENMRKENELSRGVFFMKVFLRNATNGQLSTTELDALYNEVIGQSLGLANKPVLELMKEIGSENCFIVSNGETNFQHEKIIRSVGVHIAREITIVDGSKKNAIEDICRRFPDEHIIFVDDRAKFFDDLDMSICHNLRTVLFDGENGFMSLRREMNNVRLAEVENTANNKDLKEENIFEQGLNSEIISHTDDLRPSLPPHGMH